MLHGSEIKDNRGCKTYYKGGQGRDPRTDRRGREKRQTGTWEQTDGQTQTDMEGGRRMYVDVSEGRKKRVNGGGKGLEEVRGSKRRDEMPGKM